MMNANTGPRYLFNMLRSGAMPLGQASVLSGQEYADIVAYVLSLRRAN